MREPETITVNDDARMIPVWSIVAASLAFVLVTLSSLLIRSLR